MNNFGFETDERSYSAGGKPRGGHYPKLLPFFAQFHNSTKSDRDGVARAVLAQQNNRMSKVRRALYLQLGGVLVIVGALFIASRYFPIADWLSQVQLKIMGLGVWSAICYPLLYACCNVLLLPGGLLSVGGGFFFGLWWGFLIVLVGNITGAAIALFVSRRLGRRWIPRRLRRNPTFNALEPVVRREGWKIILLSQLHPLFPTSLLNYLYGLTTIRFQTCILWIAVGQAPGLFLYAYIGTLGQLGLKLVRGETHPKTMEYMIWGGGLVVSVVVLILLGRISLRILQEAEARAKQDAAQGISWNSNLPDSQELWAIK